MTNPITREIKFRCYDELTKQWVKGFSIRPDGLVEVYEGNGTSGLLVDPINFVLQQATGLKDKNGTDVYEGDILGHAEPRKLAHINDTYLAMEIDDFPVYYRDAMFLINGNSLGDIVRWLEVEVIGNIWENPSPITKELT